MKKKMFFIILTTFVVLLFSSLLTVTSYGVNSPTAKEIGNSNPLIDHKLGADPYAIVYDGRVYIYMSSDARIAMEELLKIHSVTSIKYMSYLLPIW